jgi:hypothetical protein
MSKQTKKHRHSIHHRRRKRRYSHSHSIHHRAKTHKRLYRKSKEISVVTSNKVVPLFVSPDKQKTERIRVGAQSEGNIIPGLRNYMKNM